MSTNRLYTPSSSKKYCTPLTTNKFCTPLSPNKKTLHATGTKQTFYSTVTKQTSYATGTKQTLYSVTTPLVPRKREINWVPHIANWLSSHQVNEIRNHFTVSSSGAYSGKVETQINNIGTQPLFLPRCDVSSLVLLRQVQWRLEVLVVNTY
jgi:hypothetical protein